MRIVIGRTLNGSYELAKVSVTQKLKQVWSADCGFGFPIMSLCSKEVHLITDIRLRKGQVKVLRGKMKALLQEGV